MIYTISRAENTINVKIQNNKWSSNTAFFNLKYRTLTHLNSVLLLFKNKYI